MAKYKWQETIFCEKAYSKMLGDGIPERCSGNDYVLYFFQKIE
jgi:hypothetical protein